MAAICCCGCSNDIPKTREQAFIIKTNFHGFADEKYSISNMMGTNTLLSNNGEAYLVALFIVQIVLVK